MDPTISKFRVGMHDVIYEIQYRHHTETALSLTWERIARTSFI